jgi:hypothetical protein
MNNNSNLNEFIKSTTSSPANGPIPSYNSESKRIFGGNKRFRGGDSNVVPLNNIPLGSNVNSQAADTMQKLAQANLNNLVQSKSDSFSGGRRKSKRRKSKRRKSKRRKSKRRSI